MRLDVASHFGRLAGAWPLGQGRLQAVFPLRLGEREPAAGLADGRLGDQQGGGDVGVGAPVAFAGTLEVFALLLAVSDEGVYEIEQGETRVGLPFYLPSLYLPGLTGATLRLRPLVSTVPLLIDPPAGMQGTVLALDGLYPASSGAYPAVPFLRLDFVPGWGQAALPVGLWVAEAVLLYAADAAYPSGRMAVVPLYANDGATSSLTNSTAAGGVSTDGAVWSPALLRIFVF